MQFPGTVRATEEQPASMDELPDEMMMAVLGFLDARDLLSYARCAHRCHRQALDATLWKRLCERDCLPGRLSRLAKRGSRPSWSSVYRSHVRTDALRRRDVDQLVATLGSRLHHADAPWMKFLHIVGPQQACTSLGAAIRKVIADRGAFLPQIYIKLVHPDNLQFARPEVLLISGDVGGRAGHLYDNYFRGAIRCTLADLKRWMTHLRRGEFLGLEDDRPFILVS